MDSSSAKQWRIWSRALVDAGYALRTFDPSQIGSAGMEALSCRAILIDGALPDLARLILKVRATCANVTIIVTSVTSSYPVYYEAMQVGAFYLSDTRTPLHFATKIRNLLTSGTGKTSSSKALPRWI